ncbi:hypothetical protein Tco_0412545 [Tanacetum coccineum]
MKCVIPKSPLIITTTPITITITIQRTTTTNKRTIGAKNDKKTHSGFGQGRRIGRAEPDIGADRNEDSFWGQIMQDFNNGTHQVLRRKYSAPKKRPNRNTTGSKSDTTESSGGSASGSISDSLSGDLRRKLQAASSAYEAKKENELVYTKTSTSGKIPTRQMQDVIVFGLRKRTARAFWPPTLAKADGMYRIQKEPTTSNPTAKLPFKPENVQEILQQQYEFRRKMKQNVHERSLELESIYSKSQKRSR